MSTIAERTWTELLGAHDWLALTSAYQHQPGERTAAALLAALEPAACEVTSTIKCDKPLDPDDVRQQYQLALLETARRLPLDCSPAWIPVRLLQRARRRTVKWVAQQRRGSGLELHDYILAMTPVEVEALDGVDVSAEHPIYRHVVLGESYELQAQRLGISTDALYQRVSRDIHRLKALRSEGKLDSVADELERLAGSGQSRLA